MKGKDRMILFVVLGVVIALVVVLYFFLPKNESRHFSWRENYTQRSEQPYGTEVISNILETYFDDKDFVMVRNDLNTILSEESTEHRNYVFIGWEPYFTDSIFDLVADFVYEGNDAFLALKEIPDVLSTSVFMTGSTERAMDSTFYTTDFGDTIWYQKPIYDFDTSTYSYFSIDKVEMNFVSPAFKRDSSWTFAFHDGAETRIYEWRYFIPTYTSRLHEFDSLGTLHSGNFLNYIRIPYGEGYFYVHINPIVFTNYYQVDKQYLEYTSKVFSYLRPGDIIWDEASKSYSYDSGFDFNNEQEGPLKYILSQPSLRWSWYVILSGLILFLFFRTKRTQKAIPVMEVNENKSLEFIQTIGRMYFISKNHRLMSQQKIRLFLHFINERYHIPTNEINDAFYEKLRLKSEIPVTDIKAIFSHYRYIENTTDVSPDDLIYLHQLLDSFYKTCK